MTVSRDSNRTLPRYARIARKLAEEIRGCCQPGDKLSAEQKLANRFTVNRHTLRRAVDGRTSVVGPGGGDKDHCR